MSRHILSITHHACNRTSHHPTDVEQKYCAFCHRWLEPGEYTIEKVSDDAGK